MTSGLGAFAQPPRIALRTIHCNLIYKANNQTHPVDQLRRPA